MDGTLSVNGSLSVQFSVSWPSTSLADGSVTMASYTVVNLDKIMRQMTNAKEITDWETYLWSKAPFVSFKSQEAVFLQSKSGVWNQIVFDVLPIERGGTGVSSMPPNRYLKTDENGNAGFLAREDVIADLGQLRIMTGTYTGTGSARSIELPVAPKLILIYPGSGPETSGQNYGYDPTDNPTILSDGAKKCDRFYFTTESGGVTSFLAYVSLSGNQISFAKVGSNGGPYLCNRSGVTYRWTAIY